MGHTKLRRCTSVFTCSLSRSRQSDQLLVTNGQDRSIYKLAESFHPFIDRGTDIFSLTYVSFSLLQTPVLTKERQPSQRTPTLHRLFRHPYLRASDSLTVALLPALYQSQAHIRTLCANDKAICRACRAASKTSNGRWGRVHRFDTPKSSSLIHTRDTGTTNILCIRQYLRFDVVKLGIWW